MKQTPVKLGPLAILLTVITICLTILCILSFSTARADLSLAQKYAETVSQRYKLEIMGQESYQMFSEADTEDQIPEDYQKGEDGVWRTVLEEQGSRLSIGIQFAEGEFPQIVEWKQDRIWQEDTSMGSLWDGE